MGREASSSSNSRYGDFHIHISRRHICRRRSASVGKSRATMGAVFAAYRRDIGFCCASVESEHNYARARTVVSTRALPIADFILGDVRRNDYYCRGGRDRRG